MFSLKSFLIILLILFSLSFGFFLARWQNPPFTSLTLQEMPQRIIAERNFAIQKAIEAGTYQCCINPPCTMCYLEPNQWNNFTPGTCACDQLIAQEKEPCPQCQKGLCEKNEKDTCQVKKEST